MIWLTKFESIFAFWCGLYWLACKPLYKVGELCSSIKKLKLCCCLKLSRLDSFAYFCTDAAFHQQVEQNKWSRGKYFANSRPFSAGRVSINLIVPIEFVYKRICTYFLIHKPHRKHAFVCLVGEYFNTWIRCKGIPKQTKVGEKSKLHFTDPAEFMVS